MSKPSVHPLSDEHCSALDQVLGRCSPAIELAKACIDCGWPAESYLQTLQEQQAMAQKAKATFFPDRP